MADDPNQARAALEAEAARLAAKRVAGEQAQRDAAAHHAAERERDQHSVDPGRLRGSLSRGLFMWAVMILVVTGAMYTFAAWSPPEDSDEAPNLTAGEAAVGGLFFAGAIACLAHRFTSIGRSRRWRASLPFPIHDYEKVLGMGLFVTRASVFVAFRGEPINNAVLSELVLAKLPESVVSSHGATRTRIQSPSLSSESANWPLANWLHKLVKQVLVGVHAGYAIESITLAVDDTTEFYIPSGD